MQKFRYTMQGNWYRGNTHLHTRRSDGGLGPAEAAAMYAAAGYDFIFYTDHWVASRVTAADQTDSFLMFNGIELDGRDEDGSHYHIVGLGDFTNINRRQRFSTAVKKLREQGGIVILAHPAWMGNSIEDSFKYEFDGVEVYNHICNYLNGKGDSTYVWDAMLDQRPNTLGLAVDDAHVRPEYPSWGGGWIMVSAAERTREAILDSIRSGNFYSSCGPDFQEIACEGRSVTVYTTPVHFVRLVGPRYQGVTIGGYNQLISKATIQVPEDWKYARLLLEDVNGRRAWTNTLFA